MVIKATIHVVVNWLALMIGSSPEQLLAYISELTKMLVTQGKINGLFLTGLPDEDGVTLMTNYVNLVSYATLTSSHPPPSSHSLAICQC